MGNQFIKQSIFNTLYDYPNCHSELYANAQPTQKQAYDNTEVITVVRQQMVTWSDLKNSKNWRITVAGSLQ